MMQNQTTQYITADKINEGSNIHKKIQRGKRMFLDANLKPTGWNSFQKYKYFEMKDILPTLLDVCEELNMSTRFVFTSTSANLVIRDEDEESEVWYSQQIPVVNVPDARKAMQEIKSIQTYAMRCLYIQAFEIVEADSIEKGSIAEEERKAKKRHVQKKQQQQQKKESQKRYYIKKNEDIKPDMDEPVGQAHLDMGKVSTTEVVNMSKEVQEALKKENKELNEENIHNKVDELYKDSRGYTELLHMFDAGLKKAKQSKVDNYITY